MGSVASRPIFEGKYFSLKIKERSLAEVEAFFFFDNCVLLLSLVQEVPEG